MATFAPGPDTVKTRLRLMICAAVALGLAACASVKDPGSQTPASPSAAPTQPVTASIAAPISFGPTTASEFQSECQGGLQAATAMLEQLERIQPPLSVATVLEPYNDLRIAIGNGSGKASLYFNLYPDAAVRDAAQVCEQSWNELTTRLSLSRPVYDALSAVDASGTDSATRFVLEKQLRDFRRSGVDRDEATRDRVKVLQDEILKLGQAFGKNAREDVRQIELDSVEQLAGLPQDYIDAHRPNDRGKIVITTDYPDALPFFDYARDDAARKALRLAFTNRGYPANEPVLKELISRRHELATLLGYQSWAHYITENKMVGTPERAAGFIDQVSELSGPRAEAETARLLARLRVIDPTATSVQSWQGSYIDKLVRKEQFAVDNQRIRQYFAYDKVRDGIFDLVSTLFGVEIAPWDTVAWDASVEAYELRENGRLIGRFYLDMHPRDGKFKHAAAGSIVPGITDRQLPVSVLMCNFPGGDGTAGLMEHADVTTFLHEFGHLMHSLFASDHHWVDNRSITMEWDFAEAPSQMLEEWIWDRETLQQFATNAQGEVIPAELVEKMNAARMFGEGRQARQQMFYAALSLNYYNRDPAKLDLLATMKELQARYSIYDYLEGDHFYSNFGHLDGYSAMYYTYMWSKVIATDMFTRFDTEGMRNAGTARAYRDEVLATGGSRPAAESVKAFLGREYSFDAFADYLKAD